MHDEKEVIAQRRVLLEEKERLLADKVFLESRQKLLKWAGVYSGALGLVLSAVAYFGFENTVSSIVETKLEVIIPNSLRPLERELSDLAKKASDLRVELIESSARNDVSSAALSERESDIREIEQKLLEISTNVRDFSVPRMEEVVFSDELEARLR